MASRLQHFVLSDLEDCEHSFPTDAVTLLCFLKEDCPTCRLTAPLLEAVHGAFGEVAKIWAVGQDRAGNEQLVGEHSLSLPMLDDSALGVSFDYEIEIVPTVALADAAGEELIRFEGFDVSDWQGVIERLAALTDTAPPPIAWDDYPATRPGCGSKSVEPRVHERLEAGAAGCPVNPGSAGRAAANR